MSVSIVWIHMLPSDDEAAMRKSSKIFSDPRVRQFHDPEKKVGHAFAPGLIQPGRGPAWDIYLFYGSDAEWKEHPPAPTTFAHQLGGGGRADPDRFRAGPALPPALREGMEEILRREPARKNAVAPDSSGSLIRLSSDSRELRELFNRDVDKVRVLTLVSPGCANCRSGVESTFGEVLAKMEDARVRGYVIWQPRRNAESAEGALEEARKLARPRTAHFRTDSFSLGTQMAARLGLDRSYSDLYLIYRPGERWNNELPFPDFLMHQFPEGVFSEDFRLDPKLLRAVIRKYLDDSAGSLPKKKPAGSLQGSGIPRGLSADEITFTVGGLMKTASGAT